MRIACTGTDIRCTRRDTLTTGMVGLTAEFHFNTEWDGIIGKTAVFRSGDVAKEVLILSSGVVTVPWEVFHTAGEKLLVGVYGTDGEGNTWPAPTPYCDAGEIRKGTESAEAGEDPTPSVVDQIMAAAAEAESVAQSVRDDADSGAFDGADGANGATFTPNVSESGVISWTNDKGLPNPPARNITGPQGVPGADGYSPTVATQAITGGTEVTITDKNGDHVFDVMNGLDGQDGTPGQPGADGADGKSAYQYAVEGGYTGTEAQFYHDLSRQPVIHDQMTASDTWTINHNMGKYPSVSVVDSAGTVCEGAVTYIDSNTVVCHFNGAFSGRAYLN